MIDMGIIQGKQVFYTGNRSIEELVEAGELMALPDTETGVCFKRTERCTPLEKLAAYTVDEAKQIIKNLESETKHD